MAREPKPHLAGQEVTSTRPQRSATKAFQGAPFSDPFGPTPCAAYPIGTLDIGMVDPFDVLKARTANQIQEPNALIYLTSTAPDDEILAAVHACACGFSHDPRDVRP